MKEQTAKVLPLIKGKPIEPTLEIYRLKAYLRAVDPPRDPVVSVSRASLFKDGFIPSWVVIRMLFMAGKSKTQRRRDRFWGFVNLGFFGKCNEQ